ncbi:hypothetical protein BV25DRAFT_1818837 [Artomyces pyxidatus]|uniref:Uncharacterized protein n=1 Tax=Artomyces pyxidatus TaxID=48021 RepID=A0ACB8TJ53_9AGAM|nr:hypothetical protein BV25DRAFT_1818837 [Artomyces pyxidatus]
MLEDAGLEIPDATRKQLETQHWLELIDGCVRRDASLVGPLTFSAKETPLWLKSLSDPAFVRDISDCLSSQGPSSRPCCGTTRADI